MWASLAVQRRSEGQSEAVWHRPVGPGWWHSGSFSLEKRTLCYEAVTQFEDSQVEALEQSSSEGGSTSQQPQRLAIWQLLSRLQTAAPELDSRITSDPSFSTAQSVYVGPSRVGIVWGWGWTPSSCLQTLTFEWKSALHFNSWAKFQTFRQPTPSPVLLGQFQHWGLVQNALWLNCASQSIT